MINKHLWKPCNESKQYLRGRTEGKISQRVLELKEEGEVKVGF